MAVCHWEAWILKLLLKTWIKQCFILVRTIFHPSHKSFYSDIGLQVLNEYPTIIANGMLKKNVQLLNLVIQTLTQVLSKETGLIDLLIQKNRENKTNFWEVDDKKANTYTMIGFNKVRTLNDFDC